MKKMRILLIVNFLFLLGELMAQVGIGTTTPSVHLHVSGSSTSFIGNYIDNTNADGFSNLSVRSDLSGINLQSVGSTDASLPGFQNWGRLTVDVAASGMVLQTNGADPMTFNTNSTERMRILSGGNIGINTSTPASRLHILNTTTGNIQPSVELDRTDATSYEAGLWYSTTGTRKWFIGLDNDATDALRFWNASASFALSILESGNVGIGTSSPTERLDVFPDTDVSSQIGRTHIGNIGIADYAGFSHVDQNGGASFGFAQTSTGTTLINAPTGQPIFFLINAVSQMYLDNTGLGIGTVSPSEKLHVSGSIRMQDGNQQNNRILVSDATGVASWQDASAANTNSWQLTGNASTAPASNFVGTTDAQDLVFRTNNAEEMRITSAGNVGIGTSSPGQLMVVEGGNTTLDNSTNTAYSTTDLPNIADASLRLLNTENHVAGGVQAGIQFNLTGDTRNRIAYIGAITEATGNFGTSLVFSTNSTGGLSPRPERMRITGAGRLGFGITAPQSFVSIKGQGNVPWLSVERSSTTTEQMHFVNAEGTAYTTDRGTSSGTWTNVIESTNSDLMLTTDNNGGTGGDILLDADQVGIGITAPVVKFQVDNGTDVTAAGADGYIVTGLTTGENIAMDPNEIMARNNGVVSELSLNAEGGDVTIRRTVAGGTQTIFKNDGKVGLGITAPVAQLDMVVASAAVNGTKGLKIENGVGTVVMLENGSGHDSYVGTNSASNFHVRSNSTDRISVQSADGHVGINETTPDGHFEISADGSSGGTALMVSSNDAADGDLFSVLESGNVGVSTTSPSSTLEVSGSMSMAITTKTADYTITASDYTIIGNPSVAGITFLLPTAVGIAGRVYVIKNIHLTNIIRIGASGAETIDGTNPVLLNTQYQRMVIQSDGANWHIIN